MSIGQLTEGEIAEFKEAFSLFDRDGGGTITIKQLATILRSMDENPTDAELDDLKKEMAAVRASGDSKTVDFNEALTLVARRLKGPETDEDILQAFRVFDKEGNGYISPDELKALLAKYANSALSEKELQEIIKDADVTGNGQIDYIQYVEKLMSI
ncbi:uncharacterized protein LOC141913120 [Tubulanus polymorphus]|uniref:uncharacterized protein LOC141913120 n=1 Tax=Tubulanus polymorphus TaxID=672921 RepID=UPI003DA5DA0B